MKGNLENSRGCYVYGFNGKEMDNEVSGNGNQYDYGFRIYNPRLGKFLSVDPLASNFAWNSPYAFAENRVIDGIDLEGLEYLRADVARIQAISGRVQLKVPNMNFITRSAWNRANSNPRNWKPGEIGIDPTVARIVYNNPAATTASAVHLPYTAETAKTARLSNKTSDPNYTASQHKVSTPLTKSGKPDKRYTKERTVSGASANSGRAEKGAIALNILNWGLENAPWVASAYEESLISEQVKEALPRAVADVQTALDAGMIPEQYQNMEDLTDILNVVLQGENTTGNQDIYDIGIGIVKSISGNYQEPYSAPVDDGSARQDNTSVVTPTVK